MTEDRRYTGDPGSQILAGFLVAAWPAVQKFQLDAITQPTLIKTLRPIFQKEYGAILELERLAVAESDKQLGLESLTTDTARAHGLSWFTQTGLAFSTGIPTTAVAVAITHERVGMSASQRNLITSENVIQMIAKAAKSTFAQGMMETAGEHSLARMMTPNESLAATVGKSVNEAMTAFARLSPTGVPLEGTQISIMGGDFLSALQQEEMLKAAIQTVKVHPAMHDGRAMHSGGRGVGFNNQMGNREMGMLWGGPLHSLYPQPTFYSKANVTG